MYIMIICHWAILHYNISFKTIAGRYDGVFFIYLISCTFLKIRDLSNSTKLSCGFNLFTLIYLLDDLCICYSDELKIIHYFIHLFIFIVHFISILHFLYLTDWLIDCLLIRYPYFSYIHVFISLHSWTLYSLLYTKTSKHYTTLKIMYLQVKRCYCE